MSKILTKLTLCLSYNLMVLGVNMSAQEVAPPKARELVVDEAKRFVESRASVPALPDPLKNPFLKANASALQFLDNTSQTEVDPNNTTLAVELNQQDQLGVLASLIPATGAVRLAGTPLLLLGQTRYRVGDTVIVTFENKDYTLLITEINLVSFTVKLGDNLFTRPIRLRSNN